MLFLWELIMFFQMQRACFAEFLDSHFDFYFFDAIFDGGKERITAMSGNCTARDYSYYAHSY